MATESPDLSAYVDLTLYDKTAQDIFAASVLWLQTVVPGLALREGDMLSVLLEALSVQVAEGVFALNRLPGSMMQILALLYGIERNGGAPPTATVEFSLADALGHVIPAGVQVRLDLGTSDPIVFTTTASGQALPGVSTITVQATGDRYTADANGLAVPADVTIIDTLFYVDSAQITVAPVDGVNPETVTEWLDRFTTQLSRLTTTLTLPEHFSTAALDDQAVKRAIAVDDWNAGYGPPLNLATAPSGVGGTLTGGATYGYAVTATTAAGETLPCAVVDAVIPAGPNTGSVVLTWDAPAAETGAGAVTGYNVYRTAAGGTVLGLIASPGAVLTYTDTGGTAPGAAPPVANGTGQSLPGYVTVGVYGDAAFVTDAEKAALQATLSSQALANLGIRVVDATLTPVDVDVTVVAAAGFAAADVQTAVQTALQNYLSPQVWPWRATVPRNEVIAVIGSLTEVAYVQTLTTPAADVALPGVAPLTSPGTLTVTVA